VHATAAQPDAAPETAAAAPAAAAAAAEWVEVGVVGPPHGVRGEMKVQPLTDFPEERLGEPGPRWLRAPASRVGRRDAAPPQEMELEWGRSSVFKGRQVWLVKLEGVDCPEDVGPLRGHTLLIPAAQRAPLEDADEFYVQDLVGLAVSLAGGQAVGVVVDLFDGTGTHDVLRIQLDPAFQPPAASGSDDDEEEGGGGGRRGRGAAKEAPAGPRFVLLPFVKALVPVVDLAARRMEITPPEGLFDLATSGAAKTVRVESGGERQRRKPRPRVGGGGGRPDAAVGAVQQGSPEP
jgi:16S rRNA processing protein RimM